MFIKEGERNFELPLLNTSVFSASFHSPCQSPTEACLQINKEGDCRFSTWGLQSNRNTPMVTASLNNPPVISHAQNLVFLLWLVSKSFDHILLHCFRLWGHFNLLWKTENRRNPDLHLFLHEHIWIYWKTELSPVFQSITQDVNPWTLLPSSFPKKAGKDEWCTH